MKSLSLNRIKQAINDFDGKQSEETLNLIEKRFNELFEEENIPISQQIEKDDSFDFGYQKIKRKSKTLVELNEEMKIRQAAFLILSKYDTDRTGTLDLEQFRDFYSVINAPIKVVDSLFETIDRDKDDHIDSKELFDFLKFITIKDLEVEENPFSSADRPKEKPFLQQAEVQELQFLDDIEILVRYKNTLSEHLVNNSSTILDLKNQIEAGDHRVKYNGKGLKNTENLASIYDYWCDNPIEI